MNDLKIGDVVYIKQSKGHSNWVKDLYNKRLTIKEITQDNTERYSLYEDVIPPAYLPITWRRDELIAKAEIPFAYNIWGELCIK